MTQLATDIPINTLGGAKQQVGDYEGQVLLVVNVASQCGLTPQYTALQKLYAQWQERGFKVLAFPCNEFGAQEPGTPQEIESFCSTSYGVEFPLFEKIHVNGDARHPLYAALTSALPQAQGEAGLRDKLRTYGFEAKSAQDILWNFEKFVIGRDREVLARFSPDVEPDDPRLLAVIESALSAAPAK